MTTNIAEVLKLAAKPVQYDNDERTWPEFRFKLENYFTLVDEKYVQLLHDAESQPVTNLPAGGDETSVTIRTVSHTLYAWLATLTTGRSLRLVQRVPNRKRVRRVETVGGRERAEDRGSEIRDAASRATAGDERQSGKVRGECEVVGTPGGCL